MGSGRIDTIAAKALWPLRVLFILLLVALTVVVWRSGGLAARTADAEARSDAYIALAVESRDALLARLYHGLAPSADGETEMLGRAGRIDAAAAAAIAVAPPEEREALEEIARIAATLRRLTDDAPPQERLALYASGRGRALAARFISLADGLAAAAGADLDAQIEARARQRALLVPMFALTLAVIGLLVAASVRRGMSDARRVESNRLVPRIEAERDRADLLAREMRHRVKNIFAVIASVVSASSRGPGTPREIAERTRGRIEALARAHTLSSGDEALDEFALVEAARAVAEPYAPSPGRLVVGGDAARVPAAAATPLGLVINELSTNAIKHGAWSGEDGTVQVTVAERPGVIEMVWRESGGPASAPAGEDGFGSTMIDLSVAQLGGRIARRVRSGGIEVVLTIPDGAGAGPSRV